MKAILGLKVGPAHDTGAALVVERSGKIEIVAISQERLSRDKHSRRFPGDAINYCLNAFGIKGSDLSLVISDYIWQPEVRDAFTGFSPPGLDEKQEFYKLLEQAGVPYIFAEHHLCHVASSFYATAWDDAVGLVIDGIGSNLETQSIFSCTRSGITKLETSRKPGVGMMYASVTEKLLGFAHLQEGKTMGLAGWTDSALHYSDEFESKRSGRALHSFYPQFYLPSENQETWSSVAPEHLPQRMPDEDPTDYPYANYAYAAQAELENQVLDIVRYAQRISGKRKLAYAGGVALNILANRKILDSDLFEEFFIQPAASDSGIPLGAALLGYYAVLGGTKRWDMKHAFLAQTYAEPQLSGATVEWSGPKTSYNTAELAKVLGNDYLVAWYQGASEFGPRSLGHRSILCSPKHPAMKSYLNQEVKHREMFRPFAPIVPIERQSEYFDLSIPSPYMLINAQVREMYRNQMSAIVHADGTARVQSIDFEVNPELHNLLNAVESHTGTAVLLNTSLNLAGEPIVETPADAVDLFTRAKLDVLVIGSQVLSKRPLKEYLAQRNSGPDQIIPFTPSRQATSFSTTQMATPTT